MVVTNIDEKMAAYNAMKDYEKFVLVDADGKKHRAIKQEDDCIGIYSGRSTRRGIIVDAKRTMEKYNLIVTTSAEEGIQWKKRLTRAVKLLDKSGLWENIREVFANLLTVDYEDWLDVKKYNPWNDDAQEAFEKYGDKYPFMFNKAKDGKVQIETDYIFELSQCKLKSMYFGSENKHQKAKIAEKLAAKEKYISPRIPVSYDVTFSYSPEMNKAWYSEEYKDCGNGHYYLALDENVAVFCEDD